MFLDSADAVTELVGRIPEDDWTAHGLGDWDLRALVGHTSRAITTVADYVAKPAPRIDCDSAVGYYLALAHLPHEDAAAITARGVEAGRQMGADPVGHYHAAIARTRAALQHVPDDDFVLTTLAGGMRLRDYLPTRTFELIAHGYDIARATGLAFTPHPDAAAETAVLAARIGVAQGYAEPVIASLLGRGGPGDRSVLVRM